MLMTFARLGSKVVALLCSRRFCNYQVHPLIVIFHTLIILYGVGTLKKSVYVIRLDLVVMERYRKIQDLDVKWCLKGLRL